MITLIPVGNIYKNDKGELCAESKYDIEMRIDQVHVGNIDEKVAEFKAGLINYFNTITVTS